MRIRYQQQNGNERSDWVNLQIDGMIGKHLYCFNLATQIDSNPRLINMRKLAGDSFLRIYRIYFLRLPDRPIEQKIYLDNFYIGKTPLLRKWNI